MKLLANENIPRSVCEGLRRDGFDVASLTEYNLGLRDREVINLAKKENRILITFDKDFGELVFKKGADVEGVILLRFSPKAPSFVLRRLRDLLSGRVQFKNNFLLVEEDRVRVRKIK